ncbi:hypothetical protein ACLB2K_062783 [Fragaria x ananassa]
MAVKTQKSFRKTTLVDNIPPSSKKTLISISGLFILVTQMESHVDPGPIDKSLLYDQDDHISSAIWDGQERGVLRCHEHTSMLEHWKLTPRQMVLVEKAGFGYFRTIPTIILDNSLISALVERWRRETNTFHLPVGEMTITLEDVALILGLPVEEILL